MLLSGSPLKTLTLLLAVSGAVSNSATATANDTLRGINLPPTQGNTNAGAFLPGIYKFDYQPKDFTRIKESGFDSIRLPVNVATINDEAGFARVIKIVATMNNRAIICMFDTNEKGEIDHGNGRPNNLTKMAEAWSRIHSAFNDKPEIRYELFNEPFGYPKTPEGAREYHHHMMHLITLAGLPKERCILNGMGYADELKMVAEAGWKGPLAWHFYNTWVPEKWRTTENYSRYMQRILKSVPNEIYITEFGANLGLGDVYENTPQTDDSKLSHAHLLHGIEDALLNLKKEGREINGTYYWHGWDNDDSHSIWGEKRKWGAAKVRKLQGIDVNAGPIPAVSEKGFKNPSP